MSARSLRQVDERLERLEEEVRLLKAALAAGAAKAGWRALIGSHEGSPVFGEIVREGQKIRRAEGRDFRRVPGLTVEDWTV